MMQDSPATRRTARQLARRAARQATRLAEQLAPAAATLDIAPRGQASQSSLSQWSGPAGAQGAVRGGMVRDFAIHTAAERHPWWQLDLGLACPVDRIIIHNRRRVALHWRARSLVVEISVDGQVWTTLHRGLCCFGAAPPGRAATGLPPMVLQLAGGVVVRWLRLSLDDPTGAALPLHLSGVAVQVRSADLALARLWQDQGFDSAALIARSDPLQFRADYTVHSPTDLAVDAPLPPLTGLALRRYGRFGNALLQTSNAIALAQALGLARLQVVDFELFHLTAPQPLGGALAGLTLLPAPAEAGPDAFAETVLPGPETDTDDSPGDPPPDVTADGDGCVLAGTFYHMQVFGSTYPSPDGATRRAIIAAAIRPHLALPAIPAPAPDALVIHIRSGDIFGARPHPGYAQPPLAFYTGVIHRLRQAGKITALTIVAEDRANPCIDALEALARAQGLPCRMQAGDLGTDIAFLIQARHLVFGYGTFGYGICLLAGQIDSLTVFEMDAYAGLPNVAGLHVVRCVAGAYIARDGWTASPAQQDLMLTLPADQLVTTHVR